VLSFPTTHFFESVMQFMDNNDFTVLLYYQYCDIEDPVAILQWQEKLCESLNLKGRIRISSEGLNGTLGGAQAEVEAYIQAFDQHPELSPSTIHWKVSKATTRSGARSETACNDASRCCLV